MTDENTLFQRQALLVGETGMALLRNAHVTVFGVGGVGSSAVEALARAAVGHLRLIDFDLVNPSNTNRQLHALEQTFGQPKAEVMANRVRAINPECKVEVECVRVTPETVADYLTPTPDYVVDAIDDTNAKLALLAECMRRKIPTVSGMGAANKLLPESIRVADISKSRQCPLARIMRKKLRRMGLERGVTVVYSEELPLRLAAGGFHAENAENAGERRPQGTISYIPGIFGMYCASVVLRDLLKDIPFQRRGETPRTRNRRD